MRHGVIRSVAALLLLVGSWPSAALAQTDKAALPSGVGPNPLAEMPKRVLYYGIDEPLAEQVPLRAGPLSMVYEAGDLRYIRLGQREVLRRWYAVTRDRNWGTLTNRLTNVQMDVQPDSFHISYDVENKERDIDFTWRAEISGDASGTITFALDGTARSTFLRNRIGFCLLHPARECPGARCRYERTDGSVAEGAFPKFISPDNPFQDLKAFAHEVLPGVWAELRFTGDLFEMEDQRNWIDASFKTFCTPLRIPYPVEIKKGTRIQQTVTLRLEDKPPVTTVGQPSTSELTFAVREAAPRKLPRLGLGAASHGQPLTEKEIGLLRPLQLSHLRVDLRLNEPDYADVLRRTMREAIAIGAKCEVALFLSDDAQAELRGLSKALADLDFARHWLVFHNTEASTTERWITLAEKTIRDREPTAKIGSGTNAYFTQFNRGRPPIRSLDLVCYSINPQVHAFDNRSLVETLEAHGATVESARQFVGQLPLAVSPVTLRPRSNPSATAPEQPALPGELPSQVDVRQMSLFGACWTLGSVKYLAESGVQSATYYETTGWRGVMETEQGSPVPDKFRSIPGSVFPLYHVLADIGEFAGGNVIPSQSTDPLRIDGLILSHSGRERWLIANMTDEPQTVTLKIGARTARVKRLNEITVRAALLDPVRYRDEPGEMLPPTAGQRTLQLLPYEVARLDLK